MSTIETTKTIDPLEPAAVIERRLFGRTTGYLARVRRQSRQRNGDGIPYVRAGYRTCLYRESDVRAYLAHGCEDGATV